MRKDQLHKANLYSKLGIKGTGYLAFRDIPHLILKYVKGKITLDFGCGTGRSSRFLKNLGLIIEGADVSKEMIDNAILFDSTIPYIVIKNNKIPKKSGFYDLVFSSLVLFEISSKEKLLQLFKEIYRILKSHGIFIIVTGSTDMYKYQWLSLDTNYKENQNLKSGSLAKILLKEVNLELHDYFWTDFDYKNLFKLSKFSLLEQIYPLGTSKDNYSWVNEDKASPYVIYVLQKLYICN